MRFALGPGQQNDMAPACDLLCGLLALLILGDRAYDADRFFDFIRAQGGEPVIPPRRHLPRLRQARQHHALAQIVKMSLLPSQLQPISP